MKTYLKPKKYYFLLFALSFAIMGISLLYKYIKSTSTSTDVLALFAVPAFFVGFMLLIDYLMQKVADRKKKKDYEGLFLDVVGNKMRASKEFLIEDFRHLQISEKFQSAIKSAYLITKEGETEGRNLAHLEKKFERRSLEYRAMQYVIEAAKEQLEKTEKTADKIQ